MMKLIRAFSAFRGANGPGRLFVSLFQVVRPSFSVPQRIEGGLYGLGPWPVAFVQF